MRLAVPMSLLSGFLACLGFLIVVDFAMMKTRYPSWEFTASIEDPEEGFEFPSMLRLEASAPNTIVSVGEPLRIELRIRNVSGHRLLVPEEYRLLQHARTRSGLIGACIVEILDDDGKQIPYESGALVCGNMNILSASDFADLAPNQSKRINHPMLWWKPREPGTYTVRAAYDTRGVVLEGDLWENCRLSPEILRLVDQKHKGLFVSNPVTIVVEP